MEGACRDAITVCPRWVKLRSGDPIAKSLLHLA